ncbi:hypothetical protein LQ327_10445 [Actinomycetospora endophytica]|uniref:NmrA-like family protein n=1 Tax=Actinomycetospora endophytica TaxID=2291215 RepID=A0ABS8P9V1_9PSEU|nr:hypothetical protein [Actinomycetospora endophytica]MCD2193794.1 hypothetical protein [Actinomycetospora endophytica]
MPLPDDEARGQVPDAFFRFFRGGEYDDSGTTPVVETLLGRPPRTFRDWAAAHLGAFER